MKKEGYLTARYMGPTNEKFENSEVYRMSYEFTNGAITVWNSLGDKAKYGSYVEFNEDWDMNNVDERYKGGNPDFAGWTE